VPIAASYPCGSLYVAREAGSSGLTARADAILGIDQAIAEFLVVPLSVIMARVLANGSSHRSFPEEDHSGETLFFHRSDEAFGMGVQIR